MVATTKEFPARKKAAIERNVELLNSELEKFLEIYPDEKSALKQLYILMGDNLWLCRKCGKELPRDYTARCIKCLCCKKLNRLTANTFLHKMRRPQAYLAAIILRQKGVVLTSPRFADPLALSRSAGLSILKKQAYAILKTFEDDEQVMSLPTEALMAIYNKRSKDTPRREHPTAEQDAMEKEMEADKQRQGNSHKDNNAASVQDIVRSGGSNYDHEAALPDLQLMPQETDLATNTSAPKLESLQSPPVGNARNDMYFESGPKIESRQRRASTGETPLHTSQRTELLQQPDSSPFVPAVDSAYSEELQINQVILYQEAPLTRLVKHHRFRRNAPRLRKCHREAPPTTQPVPHRVTLCTTEVTTISLAYQASETERYSETPDQDKDDAKCLTKNSTEEDQLDRPLDTEHGVKRVREPEDAVYEPEGNEDAKKAPVTATGCIQQVNTEDKQCADNEREVVLSLMGVDPVGFESLLNGSKLTMPALYMVLFLLELDGLIVRLEGDRYQRISQPTRSIPALTGKMAASIVQDFQEWILIFQGGISRKYVQLYILLYWYHLAREQLPDHFLSNTVLGVGYIEDGELEAYVSPLSIVYPEPETSSSE